MSYVGNWYSSLTANSFENSSRRFLRRWQRLFSSFIRWSSKQTTWISRLSNKFSPPENYLHYLTSCCFSFVYVPGLTPLHLRKAKLMFFYTRYPSSVVLKNYFPDVRFDKLITAQLVKWFSNFREFFYQQIEKYARQCLAEGIRNVDDLVITPNSELYRVLNVHYNRSNQINVRLKFVFFSFNLYLFIFSQGSNEFLYGNSSSITRIFLGYFTTKRSRIIVEEKHLQSHATIRRSNSWFFQEWSLDAFDLNSFVSRFPIRTFASSVQ